MTTRLYCRECGWHPEFRRKRAALRAASRHHCTGTPVAETCRPWWSRLWTTLWTSPSGTPAVDSEIDAYGQTPDDELVDARGNRIQWAALAAHHVETTRRARQVMVELVRAGYQIGPPPYGYRALRVRVTDPTGHSKLRAVLVPDWQTAAVVTQIFSWRADHGLTFTAIAARLNSDPRQYPAPSPTGRWTAKAVRRILTNVKYTGRQVWARTVAGRPAPVQQWVTSAPKVHEPLVDERTFRRAQPGPGEPPPGAVDPTDAPPGTA
ncbi:recombinase family protein [Kibdelosporangium philippinense]|uniref:Recombinase family protein n=1 Tax=Kibdelosporangium philippinense TaxID=211113 RepID=A0ABS8ZVE0_9PSEU|nr:recombinase family protein [Kibdelosporangium philippinense]MCE7011672.1 recombinase family protein [Kibdelosporangium philippinense]